MSTANFPDRQTPNQGEAFLDHVGWYVPDMDAATAAFEKLGFILTPYIEHTDARPDGTTVLTGSANRCAMAERGYLEILTPVRTVDTPVTQEMETGLGRYTGLHLIAFTCQDAGEERMRIEADGFNLRPTVNLRRPLTLDNGEEAEAAFTVLRCTPGQFSEGRIQMLSQETPDVVWQPSLIARDNAINALSGLVIAAASPADTAEKLGRFAASPIVEIDGGARVDLARGTIDVVTDDVFRARIPGAAVPDMPFIGAVVMRSADLTATRGFLQSAGVRIARDSGDAIVVDASAAMGAYVVLHGPDVAWPY